MAKPGTAFTWATDALFGAGPDAGNSTKVNPPGWPAVVQGSVPDLGIVAAFINTVLNLLGDYTGWIFAGSSAGAADAHVVETDAAGETHLQGLTMIGDGRLRVTREDVTMADANIDVYDIAGGALVALGLQIDSSAVTAPRTLTLKTVGVENGEICLVTHVAGAAHNLDLSSDGGAANPIYVFDATPANAPDWALCMYDSGLGEWIVVAKNSPV